MGKMLLGVGQRTCAHARLLCVRPCGKTWRTFTGVFWGVDGQTVTSSKLFASKAGLIAENVRCSGQAVAWFSKAVLRPHEELPGTCKALQGYRQITTGPWPIVACHRQYRTNPKAGSEEAPSSGDTGWVIRLANENGYLSWCRNTYLATVVGVGMWAEGPSSIAFHATEGALFLGGLNLVLGTASYLHTIIRLRRRIHMSIPGAVLHTLGALTHLGIWLTVVVTYLGYVESEEEVRHPGNAGLEILDPHMFSLTEEGTKDKGNSSDGDSV